MNQLDQAFHSDHLFLIQQRTRRTRAVVLSAAGVFVAGAIGTCVASSYDEPLQPVLLTKPLAGATDDKAPLSLMSVQVKEASEIDELKQQIVAERAEVKRLSEQLSTLVSRMGALEASLERAQQSSNASAFVSATVAESSVPPPSPAPAAARPAKKRAPERRPVGPISLGGAPLATASATAQQ